jgi:hypothetical protein
MKMRKKNDHNKPQDSINIFGVSQTHQVKILPKLSNIQYLIPNLLVLADKDIKNKY